MKKLVFIYFILALLNVYASIGKITFINGTANILREEKNLVAKLGDDILSKDIITTEVNSKLQIIFNDKTVVTIGNKSKFSIDDYYYNENNSKDNKLDMNFSNGFFKTITGKIGKINPSKFKLNTKSASIGIRGTQIVMTTDSILGDFIACTSGEISVTSKLTGNSVIVPSGNFTKIKSGINPTKPEAYTNEQLNKLSNNPPIKEGKEEEGSRTENNNDQEKRRNADNVQKNVENANKVASQEIQTQTIATLNIQAQADAAAELAAQQAASSAEITAQKAQAQADAAAALAAQAAALAVQKAQAQANAAAALAAQQSAALVEQEAEIQAAASALAAQNAVTAALAAQEAQAIAAAALAAQEALAQSTAAIALAAQEAKIQADTAAALAIEEAQDVAAIEEAQSIATAAALAAQEAQILADAALAAKEAQALVDAAAFIAAQEAQTAATNAAAEALAAAEAEESATQVTIDSQTIFDDSNLIISGIGSSKQEIYNNSILKMGYWVNPLTGKEISTYIDGTATPAAKLKEYKKDDINAQYNGAISAIHTKTDGSSGAVGGSATFDVDFGKKKIDGTFVIGGTDWKTKITDISIDKYSSFSTTNIQNNGSSTTGISGTINGKFYGPNAENIGGNIDMNSSNNGSVKGSYATGKISSSQN
jgi:hypothetical protein